MRWWRTTEDEKLIFEKA